MTYFIRLSPDRLHHRVRRDFARRHLTAGRAFRWGFAAGTALTVITIIVCNLVTR